SGLGHLRRVLDLEDLAVLHDDLVDDGGRRGDEVHVELTLEALLDDVHVKHPEEAAAETETERLRYFGLVAQRGIVELQLLERIAHRVELAGFDRIEPGEDRGLDLAEAGHRLPRL